MPDASFDNADIGADTVIEPGAQVGLRYHQQCGRASIGPDSIIRAGAIIYGDVSVGRYFQAGHYAVLRAKVTAGDYFAIGNHSTIEGLSELGEGVRLMSNVYIPSRTRIGNHVFIGPGTTCLNDKLPGRRKTPATPIGPTIEDDVMIGGGCTILPGVRIGQRSFIAAGSVITKDIPPRSLVMGSPGRIQPLPAELDQPNDRRLTRQPVDLWHPATPDLSAITWPDEN